MQETKCPAIGSIFFSCSNASLYNLIFPPSFIGTILSPVSLPVYFGWSDIFKNTVCGVFKLFKLNNFDLSSENSFSLSVLKYTFKPKSEESASILRTRVFLIGRKTSHIVSLPSVISGNMRAEFAL